MNWIKKIVVAFLTIVLINLFCLLAISFNLKKVIIDGVIKETITQKITKKDQQEGNFIITEETINQITDDERIKEVLQSKEVEELINKYLDITIDSMIDESSLDQIALEKDMLDFLKDNKESLEKSLGQEITEEAISNTEKQLEERDWSRSYKQTIQNASNSLTTTEKTVLKGYKFIISNQFRWILLGLIVLDILLLSLIQKSIYKWMSQFSKSMLISGILLGIICIGVKVIVNMNTNLPSFHMNSLLFTGIGMSCVGIVLMIIDSLLEKKIEKEKENEISKTLNGTI